ncbi:hypothetical protein PFICI_01208 [Pestalotiopsis fici W106-1]|uniref:FMN hydroxy acid dehydrogenase domain-containing protein n=1 Tax=Pestalotiopsis fici (strain W106-1 / CGMCC3.15140) TaxID=1229662 RepID=W3XN67_PESFW|nr:uncharacterized protein PFICI_01208 [Pestalotiopsis fici W106-1]ETS87380.1 hypothetical protein PFICI_01208 [Pestalotiopsis fici W106-1]
MGLEDDGSSVEDAPSYGQYQLQIYAQGIFGGVKPAITTDPNKLREQAQKAMSPEAFNYIAGGAGEGATVDANRLAFRQWKIVPRMLRPTVPRDLKVELFGRTYQTPILQAPVGVQSVYHADREIGTASACAELGVPYIMSTALSSTIQEVASALGGGPGFDGGPPPWFQLYWPVDDEITGSILQTAQAAGFEVLVVTLDTATMSWRPADLDRTFLPFIEGIGNAVGFADPVFRRKFAEQQAAENENDGTTATPEDNVAEASRYWIREAFSGDSHPWRDLALLRRHWGNKPIVLKGIQDPRDAVLALQAGMDGIVVSNHGGRQCDGAAASLDMLPEIVDAVGDRMTVLFDSGIRTGADVFKALSLGAKAVLFGRPVMYGLGLGGKDGARHVLASILADLDQTLGLAGVKSVSELNKTNLRRVSYPGDIKSSL